MENLQGVPGEHEQPSPDLPSTPTQTVDHTGRVPTTQQNIPGVDMDAIATWLRTGQPTGPWTPLVNDCNTWASRALSGSTPHDLYGMGEAAILPPDASAFQLQQYNIIRNVVIYSNGTIHAPGVLSK